MYSGWNANPFQKPIENDALSLSVLKSHSDSACIGICQCKQLSSKSGKDSLAHNSRKKGFASQARRPCEWGFVRIVLFVGNGGFRFRRFKKVWRALATRAKTHCLDQNRQSPGCIAQHSNHWHWAKTTTWSLTYKLLKQCYFYSWIAKRKIAFQELVVCERARRTQHDCNSPVLAELGDEGMAPDKDGTCSFCPNLSFCQEITWAYALVQHQQMVLGSLTPRKTMKLWRLMIWAQMTIISCTSYISINKVMSSVDKLRPRIFSVYRMNSQANSIFSFRKSHKQLI